MKPKHLLVILMLMATACVAYVVYSIHESKARVEWSVGHTVDPFDTDASLSDSALALDTVGLGIRPTTTPEPQAFPSGTQRIFSSSRHDDFNDGYERGLEDAEDDANHDRYGSHKSHNSEYERGYQAGYEEVEEDEEWDDDGGDPMEW